jgi:predicted DNA-binding transcriptional regulator YafY
LLLDDDEAIAVSVALRELSLEADATLGEAALSASTKLRQVLPEALRDRVDALGEVVVGVRQDRRRRHQDSDGRIALPSLMALAMCCRRGERVRFTYRDGSDRVSERRVEPHRLVSLGRRWYLVGFDLDRDDWRTYRVDRISDLEATGHRSTPRETPDAGALVAEGVAVRVFEWRTRVLVNATAQEAAMYIGPTIGVVEEATQRADRCIVTIGGDPDWVARFLAGLPVDFEILDPPEVREELRSLAERLLARVGASATP